MDENALISEFRERFGSEPQVFSAPGRVNLIGEHTDYNEGFVLPFAIDKRIFLLCSPRSDGRVKAYSRTLGEEIEFAIDRSDDELAKWGIYLKGVIDILAEAGMRFQGADVLVDSDIPFGAGLSSSAALEVAAGVAFSTLAGALIDLKQIALNGQRVENEFVGVRSGIMDQFASALAKRDHALLIDCRSQETEDVPLKLDTHSLVVCDTQVKHELASSEYNERRAQCEEGVRILTESFPGTRSLRDINAEQLSAAWDKLPEPIGRRCRHVVAENARTLAAVQALRRGDLEELGRLMSTSHDSLRLDYEVSCPELDVLVETALSTRGVLGSRMTGGGFGGCTITLVESGSVRDLTENCRERYSAEFGREPDIFEVHPSDGVRVAA